MVNTPVLFETFVRVDYARQVWDAIKAAQPKKLYFYSNKGRVEKDGEIERNNEIRSWVNEIDWDCELHTFFRDECVDVYTSLKGAISWLFENEEDGIILEDDCIPTPSFFSYIDQLIVKFRDEKRVWCLSGDNIIRENYSGYDYFYSHYHAMYGWASWRDRWEKIQWDNLRIKETIDDHIYYQLFKTKEQAEAKEKFYKGKEDFLNKTKCWDFIFGLVIDQNNGVTIQPREHLVKNIGLMGTHAKSSKVGRYNVDTNESSDVFVITKEPPFIFADLEHDYQTYCQLLKNSSIIKRIIKRIIK